MSFWQENYAFIKDVYDMRHHKMAEWMENVEKVQRDSVGDVEDFHTNPFVGNLKDHG